MAKYYYYYYDRALNIIRIVPPALFLQLLQLL